ncbi:ABC transporter substrate-binding protein [Paenibacillus humicola]|uniref:ABC transporter substrate-binding protein n=1 Tax=Paenibacillus humicola TaxID=3110540 RepID=UPI00237B230E|nr:sugar ABC transporter substrate-binding protein [Paenibacillus humicola]
MRKYLGVLVLALLVAITTACGSGTGGGPAASGGGNGSAGSGGDTGSSGGSGSGKQVELRMMWWGDQKRADRTNAALRLFEQKNPDIKVVGEFAPQTGYFDKLNTQIASGTAPDVFFLGGNVTDYAQKGVLLDLQPYVGKQLDLSDMDKAMIQYGTIGGKLVHISAGANARGVVINTALFKKAGIPIPSDDWDWDTFAKISKELSDKLGKGYYGTYDYTKDGLDIAFKQNGKQLYDMENNKLGFDEQDAEKWFAYWDQMHKNGGVVTPELYISNPPGDTSKSLIVAGKVAMGLIPSNQFGAHQSLMQDQLTMLQVPKGPKGHGVVFESSQGMSAYAKTQHPEEVARLMNFWINDPDAAKILGNDRGVPVTSKMRELLSKDASPADKIVYQFCDTVSKTAAAEQVKVSYNPPGSAEFDKLEDTTMQEIGFGRKSVQEAAKDFYDSAVKIFDSNKP